MYVVLLSTKLLYEKVEQRKVSSKEKQTNGNFLQKGEEVRARITKHMKANY